MDNSEQNGFDAAIVGSGPNGLAAAIRLAQAGLRVVVMEKHHEVGGGARTAELTLPGFKHDVCSAIHPLAYDSSFFSALPLHEYGLEWITPPAALAHPFDDGHAVELSPDMARSVASLAPDGEAHARLFGRLVRDWERLRSDVLAPAHMPRHPITLARFGLSAARSAASFARSTFRGSYARGAFAGLAAHSFLPLEKPPSAAFGLMLGLLCHQNGWPFPKGGAQALSDALAAHLRALGGHIVLNRTVAKLDDAPDAKIILLDTSTRHAATMLENRLPERYRKTLDCYRYGPGVFKIDWALSQPIPFTASACARAGTVHLGGTLESIAEAESIVAKGGHPERPFVLLASHTPFDPSRAPAGKHTAWAYCHVPSGSTVDMTAAIEQQVERFAPGFRDTILARHTMTTRDYETYNPNLVGGDINGGVADLWQLAFRPTLFRPYNTPVKGVYLCSASTPPGGGVHGMCGYWAAEAALKAAHRT